MMHAVIPFLIVVTAWAGRASADAYSFHRIYRAGETFGYRLRATEWEDGKLLSDSLGESRHVVQPGPPFSEEVRWEKLLIGEQDASSLAQAMPPYPLSLAPGFPMQLPKVPVTAMVGMVTDLATFYAALGVGSGIEKVTRPGSGWIVAKLLHPSWQDQQGVFAGENCTRLTQAMDSLDSERAHFRSRYQPPAESCLKMWESWMSVKVSDAPNNFQMWRRTPDGRREVSWGSERFTVTTEVRRADGMLLSGAMENRLRLKRRTGDGPVIDVEVRRKLVLSVR
jgi:hypothetical protein